MVIRPARASDLTGLVALAGRLHRESAYRELDYREEKVAGYVALVLDCPARYCLHVAEHDERLVGFLAGYLEAYVFGHETVAHDTAFFVEPAQRGSFTAKRLIGAFVEWAHAHGAREVCLGVSSGIAPERVGRFYERLGFHPAGAIYKQRVGE
jgi:GNAT superfamily N-acetyltransferase